MIAEKITSADLVDAETIVRAVCAHRKVTRDDLMGNTRAFMWARHELCYQLRDLSGLSLARLGTFMARDHTSIINGRDRVLNRMHMDAAYAEEVAQQRLCIFAMRDAPPPVLAEPLVILARRIRQASRPDPADIHRLALSTVTLRTILSSADMTAEEARAAAMDLLGEGGGNV